jgi:protein phosphatase PTC1
VDLVRNVPDAQEASKILVDYALARFSTDNLSCMVIRLDTDRVKEVINRTVDPIGVVGDPSMNIEHGVSEADKILEGARKSMANADIADDTEAAEKANEELLQKMAGDEGEPGPDISVDNDAPAVNKLDAKNGSP